MTNSNHEKITKNPNQASSYEIHVKGYLIPRWEEWFVGLKAELLENDEIVLTGIIQDQAALQGLIARLHDLNLELLSVKKYE